MPLAPLTRPIVFFDLETTGLWPDVDRIIEIALLKRYPDDRVERLSQRFDPGIKIPAESSAIHGMSNADLAGQPAFKEWAPKLFDIFRDTDLGGYALMRLDVPILTKEFDRAGFHFSMEGRRIVDASVIFRERERRDLTSAYRFYCGKTLVGAHGAEADNDAAYEVFLAQLERYPNLPRDVEGINAFCTSSEPSQVDKEGKLVWRDAEAYFNFGKHRYRSLEQVTREDPDYIDWIVAKGDFPMDFIDICRNARRGNFPRKAAGAKK
ncbi:MAG: 3'-5' exonuclease [Elusimicrobia bacterium]|nr:3'-5' exonuclease [Elusimicrobiota bacterium]